MLFIENFPHVAFHATPWLLAAWNAMAVDKFVPKPKKETNKGDEDVSEKTPEKPEDKTIPPCDWAVRLRAVRTTICLLIDSRIQKVSEAGSDQLPLSGLSHSKLPLM